MAQRAENSLGSKLLSSSSKSYSLAKYYILVFFHFQLITKIIKLFRHDYVVFAVIFGCKDALRLRYDFDHRYGVGVDLKNSQSTLVIKFLTWRL